MELVAVKIDDASNFIISFPFLVFVYTYMYNL